MMEPTQASPDPPPGDPPVGDIPIASGRWGPPGTSPNVQMGLVYWLVIVTVGGAASVLLGHPDGGLLFAIAGVFALAQSTDAAVVLAGYREWVRDSLPARSPHGPRRGG